MPQYGDPEYWDERYKKTPEPYDWLQDFDSLRQILETLIDRKNKILHIGCGNSLLSEEMYDNGFKHIENIDISQVCIDQMTERNQERPEMTWKTMDVKQLQYQDETFDVVLDKSKVGYKSGTMDALLCGDDATLNVAIMMKEVQRVLKTGGIYLMISYGNPEFRSRYLVTRCD